MDQNKSGNMKIEPTPILLNKSTNMPNNKMITEMFSQFGVFVLVSNNL